MVKASTAVVTILALATSAFAAPTGPFYGPATWSYQGLGACGKVTKDTDFVVGVSQKFFNAWPGYDGKNPNNNPICGHKIHATYKGKSVTVAITDSNPGAPKHKLNFSPVAFKKLADLGAGTIYDVKWTVQ